MSKPIHHPSHPVAAAPVIDSAEPQEEFAPAAMDDAAPDSVDATGTETHAADAHGHENVYDDPHFWVAVAFALFFVVFLKYILPKITVGLDKRSAAIAHQLEQATRLREEAEKLLAASKIQQEEMRKDAEAILAQAEVDAKEIARKAAEDLTQTLARRATQTDEKIARAERDAVATLRASMIDVATAAARQAITTHMAGQAEDPAIAHAIQAIDRQMH